MKLRRYLHGFVDRHGNPPAATTLLSVTSIGPKFVADSASPLFSECVSRRSAADLGTIIVIKLNDTLTLGFGYINFDQTLQTKPAKETMAEQMLEHISAALNQGIPRKS